MNMKKILLPLMLLLTVTLNTYAGDGDQFFTLNTGIMFRNTLNASFGYEKELSYDKVCSKSFWKNYYWNGGIVYKKSLVRWRNSTLRLNVGPIAGAVRGDYFFGAEGSFEYSYTLRSGVKLVLKQKNNVCFMHGDTFRNGLTVGIKIPL